MHYNICLWLWLQIFTKVFGAGTKTAQEWIEKGWMTVDEVKQNYTKGDWRLRFGRANDFVDKLLYNMNY